MSKVSAEPAGLRPLRHLARALLALGAAHVLFGLIRYAGPLSEALQEGLVGRFAAPEIRRTAFWFLITGPLLMLTGQLAGLAVARQDPKTLSLIGRYLLLVCGLGVLAFPLSPLWLPFLLAFPLLWYAKKIPAS